MPRPCQWKCNFSFSIFVSSFPVPVFRPTWSCITETKAADTSGTFANCHADWYQWDRASCLLHSDVFHLGGWHLLLLLVPSRPPCWLSVQRRSPVLSILNILRMLLARRKGMTQSSVMGFAKNGSTGNVLVSLKPAFCPLYLPMKHSY